MVMMFWWMTATYSNTTRPLYLQLYGDLGTE